MSRASPQKRRSAGNAATSDRADAPNCPTLFVTQPTRRSRLARRIFTTAKLGYPPLDRLGNLFHLEPSIYTLSGRFTNDSSGWNI